MIRIISISPISLVLRSALLSLSKDARVSKDGHRRGRARGHPSRRPPEERGLLRMRSVGLISIVRCDWLHGIDLLEVRFLGFRNVRVLVVVVLARIFGTDPFRY